MLITEPWSAIADQLGVVASTPPPDSGADIVLAGAGWPSTAYRTMVFPAPIRPAAVRNHAAAARDLGVWLLVIVPSASAGVSQAALDESVSLLVVPDTAGEPITGFLFSSDGRRDLTGPVARSEPSRRPGRIPWATYALAFELLETPGVSQRTLAQRIGVTQPRISQALHDIGDVVQRTRAGWVPRSHDRLADWILVRYPWRPKMATSWLTLDEPVAAVRRVMAHLRDREIEHAVGGDVAADAIAPWARPSTAWVWAAAPVDLQQIDATPTAARAANLFLAVSADPYLLTSTRRAENGDPILSPWRIWVDLVHQGHDDGADGLRDHLMTQEPSHDHS